jgi:hypothetical protein
MMAKFIFLCEKAWRNSALSVARFWGGVKIDGVDFNIIGERHDLVRDDWCKVYNRLGRERTIELINSNVPLSEAKKLIKAKSKKHGTNQTSIDF